ncbi:MAG: YkgJ family cysteine cluster protein [Sphingobacteriia bacterium]|nr:YkgJ family cysteine cluster protein [Sphingobacteriia bacterium]
MAAFTPQTDLNFIRDFALLNETTNDRFKDFLREKDDQELDTLVQELDALVSPAISCTDCGNCCKSLMVCLNETEATALAGHLHQTREEFDARYLEKGSNGMMIMNQMPCPFLSEDKCTVYEYRFEGCREFPALHLPHFKRRLFTTFMHYDRCPIIFNVVEQIKERMDFE